MHVNNVMEVDEHVDKAMVEAPPPTKKLCSCGAELSSLSEWLRNRFRGHKKARIPASTKIATPVCFCLRGEIANQLKVAQFGNCGPLIPSTNFVYQRSVVAKNVISQVKVDVTFCN